MRSPLPDERTAASRGSERKGPPNGGRNGSRIAVDGDELASRLESFRSYLLLLARVQIDGRPTRGFQRVDAMVDGT